MSLGTVDENGVWVADLIYTFDDELSIYWLSDKRDRHSAAIVKNPHVAATITPSDRQGMSNAALQMDGTAEMIEGDIHEMAVRLNLKKGKPVPDKEGEILDRTEAKYGFRHNWFRLKPKKIIIYYAMLYGLQKQVLEL